MGRQDAVDRLAALADLVDLDGEFRIRRDENGRYEVAAGLYFTDGPTVLEDAVDQLGKIIADDTYRQINHATADSQRLGLRAHALGRLGYK